MTRLSCTAIFQKSIFALVILGCKDMNKLWTQIVSIADKTGTIASGTIASGDTASGFGNTAMVLADRNYIRKGFEEGMLNLSDKEQTWLDILFARTDNLPEDEEEFIANVTCDCDKFDPKKYDM
jgi:hypothetical protein